MGNVYEFNSLVDYFCCYLNQVIGSWNGVRVDQANNISLISLVVKEIYTFEYANIVSIERHKQMLGEKSRIADRLWRSNC